MTATFWTGSSLSFTNGSKTVTVNTGPSLDSVKANSSLTAGNYNEPVEVKSVSGNTITLYNNWPGSTGTTSATIKPSAAAAASAGVAAQQLITDIQSLVSSASATATTNSFVKRDSNGRIKASSPSANDDVVTKGYFQDDSALDAAGVFHEGNSVNPLVYGLGTAITSLHEGTLSNTVSFADLEPQAMFTGWSSGGNYPEDAPNSLASAGVRVSAATQRYSDFVITCQGANITSPPRAYIKSYDNTNQSEWVELYHSGNTNFNEFGGNGADTLGFGFADSSSTCLIFLPLNSNLAPSSLTVTGSFILRNAASQVASNVPAADITLNSVSGEKWARVRILNRSGFTVGEPIELIATDSASKIKVNF